MNVPKFGASHAVPCIHMQIFCLCGTHCHCNDDDDKEKEEYDDDDDDDDDDGDDGDDDAMYSYANIAFLQSLLSSPALQRPEL